MCIWVKFVHHLLKLPAFHEGCRTSFFCAMVCWYHTRYRKKMSIHRSIGALLEKWFVGKLPSRDTSDGTATTIVTVPGLALFDGIVDARNDTGSWSTRKQNIVRGMSVYLTGKIFQTKVTEMILCITWWTRATIAELGTKRIYPGKIGDIIERRFHWLRVPRIPRRRKEREIVRIHTDVVQIRPWLDIKTTKTKANFFIWPRRSEGFVYVIIVTKMYRTSAESRPRARCIKVLSSFYVG